MTISLTPEMVINLWASMCGRYNIKIIPKHESRFAELLRFLYGMSEIDWGKCNVMVGHTLYTDIIPGIVDSNTSLLGQVCSITHECQHIIQYDSERAYLTRYFLSSRYRARKEIEAYICNMEIYHELTGEMIPVFAVLDKLESYRLCSKDLRIADEMLKERFNSIRLGGVKNDASKAVIAWLTQYQIVNKCSIRHRSLTAYSDYQKLLV